VALNRSYSRRDHGDPATAERRRITVVLVTHEDDIARHASRVITFRDGRGRADTPVANPTDAEAELATRVEEAVA
jgi:ABC-type lipoprotein export system ATPase subunit